jgi:hypothetical protein
MSGEKRTARRKSLKYPARLDAGDGKPLRECMLADISETGARIVVKQADDIPERVTLLIGSQGVAPRQCRVVWRDGVELGLEFRRKAKPATASLARRSL